MARKTKRPRRKPNTGCIRYKKGRPLPWEAEFPLGHDQKRYDSFASWEEAAAHLDRLAADRDSAEQPRNIAGGSQRLDRFLTDWLESKAAHVKPKTLENYTYFCDLAIGYFGGAIRIDSITREDANRFYTYLHARTFKDIAQLRMVLGQAFAYAEDEDYIRKNPFRRAKAPEVEHRGATVLTKAQRAAMLGVAGEIDPWLTPLWHLYSRVGLRRGEGIGLLWGNIDWNERTITITQQYTYIGGDTVQSTPKTKRSRRTFPLPDDIMEMLFALKKAQAKRAAETKGWELTGLVFTDDHGRRLTVDHIRWRWTQIKRKTGISIRIHDLRHTALYHMEQAGVPESVRMAFAGHSAAAMAKHYADHADLDAMREALKKLG